jgi:transcriptional regulator with XRE-family HTH domain
MVWRLIVCRHGGIARALLSRVTTTPRDQIAKRIRLLRRQRGWSQERLADLSGLHRAYVGTLERAAKSPTVDTLAKIASALGITIRELIDCDDVE